MWRVFLTLLFLLITVSGAARPLRAQDLNPRELTAQNVLDSIQLGRDYLIREQRADGSWSSVQGDTYTVGTTSLCTLALVNSGMTASDPPVRKALQYLRGIRDPEPARTYEISLMIMALVAARDTARNDLPRIALLARRLEDGQIKSGNAGAWTYTASGGGLDLGGDRSNSQYAVLGLREAMEAGVKIDRKTWERIEEHWKGQQNGDGGWGYTANEKSTGSMTVAGIATMAIVQQALQDDKGVTPDGKPPCCKPAERNESLERGLRWMGAHFSATQNPGSGNWLLYYLYGVERAGRLSGQRFFGQHDWYREGAEILLKFQDKRVGAWVGVGSHETHRPVATSFALLFLSKGLAPVLINKLKFGDPDPNRNGEIVGDEWNRHPRDVRNLVEYVSSRPLWPPLLTSQDVDLAKAVAANTPAPLLQAPVMFMTGEKALNFKPAEIQLFKAYMQQGGFILATPNCQSAEFEESFKEFTRQVMPPGEGELKKLTFDHPVYRSEFLLEADSVELWGVDSGCRTPIVYCPEDLGCYWNHWMRHDPPARNPNLKGRIVRANQIGVNVIAYATGREPPNKLESQERILEGVPEDRIERGLLQLAKIEHTGGWDAAPAAVRNLLTALNDTVGVTATPKVRTLPLSNPNLFKYPLVYMHGRNSFDLPAAERAQLRAYLERGGVLFADACCGSKSFDGSFRQMLQQTFPDRPLTRVPVDHAMFSTQVGRDVRRLKRRFPNEGKANQPIEASIQETEPFIEGIEIDGRVAVIYSKYDISCALERQSSVNCEGYLPEDAVKLAVNLVLYAVLQQVPLPEPTKE